jgi:rhodanese-related sulfurtransferase
MKTLIAIVFVVIFLVVGIGAGYVLGGSGAAMKTTTMTSSSVITSTQVSTMTTSTLNTQALDNYFATAAASTYSEGWYFITRPDVVGLLNNNNGSIYVLDVRLAPDYQNGHIPGAVNVPFPNMTAALTAGQIPQGKIIIVICYVGESAANTVTILRLLGYTAYDLEGGMAAWNNATRLAPWYPVTLGENYPIVTGAAPGTWTTFTPTTAGDIA